MISNSELIQVLDFLSGRLEYIEEDWWDNNRDEVIADVFDFIDDLKKKGAG